MYDIRPTSPLPGLHLDGLVTRRFLISYPVQPEVLSPLLPPNAEPSTWQGLAWVSACFVNFRHLRPAPAPAPVGIGFNCLIHRTRARLPYPDGTVRESVLVLEANMNNGTFAVLGRRLLGVRFQARDVQLLDTADYWRVQMRDDSQSLLYQADIAKRSIADEVPSTSCFPDLATAESFLLNVAYGAEWDGKTHYLHLFAETHDPWRAQAGTCRTHHFAFLESIAPSALQADHVITMTNTPHYLSLWGTRQKL